MRERVKLINAIIYFAKNTKRLGKIKLFKLLWFLDVRHFRETGRTVTGLQYNAQALGPVPQSLFNEIDHLKKGDLAQAIAVQSLKNSEYNAILILPKKEFDPSVFSKRELKILKETAEMFCNANTNQVSEISHEKGGPWHQIYVVQKKKNRPIPIELALDVKGAKISKEDLEEIQELDELALKITS